MTDVDVGDLSLPDDVLAKLAELDLELSEGIHIHNIVIVREGNAMLQLDLEQICVFYEILEFLANSV